MNASFSIFTCDAHLHLTGAFWTALILYSRYLCCAKFLVFVLRNSNAIALNSLNLVRPFDLMITAPHIADNLFSFFSCRALPCTYMRYIHFKTLDVFIIILLCFVWQFIFIFSIHIHARTQMKHRIITLRNVLISSDSARLTYIQKNSPTFVVAFLDILLYIWQGCIKDFFE